MRTLLMALAACLLVGCDDPAKIRQNNAVSLTHPETIGTTEDGLVVKRYIVEVPDRAAHYVYRVDGREVLTENHTVSNGKVSHHVATVIINGKEYVEVTPEKK